MIRSAAAALAGTAALAASATGQSLGERQQRLVEEESFSLRAEQVGQACQASFTATIDWSTFPADNVA
ncbi:MAG: hypothetical protein MI723_07935, partial [Caulobacterales bacterium]|nr:hypothetical protein [Caulobacterales bacterium]